jgi:ubiquinone/menaquinone biosynthesis C-methylase UbiE
MMQKKTRWVIAQEQEQKWWKRGFATIDFEYFARFAAELLDVLHGTFVITRQTRVLEIGSGPAGILTHLSSDFRIGIDPLEQFFGKMEICRRIRDKGVRYLAAQGEYLPFPDNSFDFIIMDNILDHCEDVAAFMGEVKRVLKPQGILYLRNFTFTGWGFILAELLEFFTIDRGHPYHFREKDLRRLFLRCQLEIIAIKRRGFFTHYKNLLTSKKLSLLVRAASLSWADKVLFILRNIK